jgi:hypothetical protein
MSKNALQTTLHLTLESLAETPAGFSASEVTGYSPEQVRRAAEALVADGRLCRANVSARRVRYFVRSAQADAYIRERPRATPQPMVAGSRAKAAWSVDEPGLITPQTRIVRATPPPCDVYRTNTYQQF